MSSLPGLKFVPWWGPILIVFVALVLPMVATRSFPGRHAGRCCGCQDLRRISLKLPRRYCCTLQPVRRFLRTNGNQQC